MKKILFATYRNILTTSGELRLIKNRAESLFNEHSIVTDFIVISKKSRIAKRNEKINAGGDLSVFPVSIMNPLISLKSYFGVRKEIRNRLKTNEYGTIVLSGPAMGMFAKRIKREFNIPIITDSHGVIEDTIEYAKGCSFPKNIMMLLYYRLIERPFFARSIKYTDAFFVVTEALKEHLIKRFDIRDNVRFFIIPCATEITQLNIEQHLENRGKYRSKYDVKDDEIIFIYSGGISSWQCVDKTVELYRHIADQLERKTRMLIFSHRKEYFMQLIGNDSRIEIDSYQPEELIHVLHAGDFAFLLRENNPTNNVAFPNKYLEYVQSGMKIITTPYIIEIAKQVKEGNLGFLYNFDSNIQPIIDYIQNTDLGSYCEKEINEVLQKNNFSTTTQDFCQWYLSERV